MHELLSVPTSSILRNPLPERDRSSPV